jgi:hypothetical protein
MYLSSTCCKKFKLCSFTDYFVQKPIEVKQALFPEFDRNEITASELNLRLQ